MFPAYGGGAGYGGRGGGRGGRHGHNDRGGNWGGGSGQGGHGYMVDRGGDRHHGGGGRGGYGGGGGRGQQHYGGGGGRDGGRYQNEVVEVGSSDDDNVVQDAVGGDDRRKKRNRSRSPSGSHSKKKKRRSRSRSPPRHHDRHGGNDRGSNRQRESRWDNNDRQSYPPHQQHNQYGGGGGYDRPGPSNWGHGPPQGLMHMNPWQVDANPFDLAQQQMYNNNGPPRGGGGGGGYHDRDGGRRDYHRGGYDDRGRRDFRDRGGRNDQAPNEDGQMFRLDSNSEPRQNENSRGIAMSQKSCYDGGVGKGIFGASEQEITQVYSKFHTLRCKMPETVSSSSEDEDDSDAVTKKESLAKDYISCEKERDFNPPRRNKMDRDFESYSFDRKDGEKSIKEQIEYYNKETRASPQNVALWKDFVQFQDKVFEESDQIFDHDHDSSSKRKRKSNRKALLEKKISILEKAIEVNPKNVPLQLVRLDYLLEVYKPRHVLQEWKKIVAQHQQSAPFWTEYLLFSASQLMVYSTPAILSVFDTCFQKFRLMMNPQYPEFQRPVKFPLFISDITFGLSLLLKSSGFMERAVSLHQAQLEWDFHCPKQLFKDQTLMNWKEEGKVFEDFWDAGTPRFGEPPAKGWSSYVADPPSQSVTVAVSDQAVSDFEDNLFEQLNEKMGEKSELKIQHKSNIWVNLESCRSKLYWLPWRQLCSDVEDCEDAQRAVLSSDVLNFVSPVPFELNFVSDFDRQAAYFRHVVNFLMLLREDFTPHTQSFDLACSPLRRMALTESSSLFSEIYYWRRIADLYVANGEASSKQTHVFAPEGFKIGDLVSPSVTTVEIIKPALFDLTMNECDEEADGKRKEILIENDKKFMQVFHHVINTAMDHLDEEFCCVLFEMLVRFEQKLTCTRGDDVKQRMKLCKEVMKHEKVRNSLGGYRELAVLEYFGGNPEKARESLEKAAQILEKTINVTGKVKGIAGGGEWEEVNWDQDWSTLTETIALYRQLAELWLYPGDEKSDAKSYYALTMLGNCFHSVECSQTIQENGEEVWKPKTNQLLKATRGFERTLDILIPPGEDLVQSQVYMKWGGNQCVEFLLQKKNLIVEWVQCCALFQYFAKDFDAASQVFEKVLSRLSAEALSRRDSYSSELIRVYIREQLYISWCNLAARSLIKDPLMNSKFRNILAKALEEFPSSPPLLILFTDVENQTSVAGKLWRLMMANMKSDAEKNITHWAPLIMGIGLARKIEELEQDEEEGLPIFGLGGPAVPQDTIFYKLDSMISVAEQHPGARHCPLLWRVHLKMLALRARDGKDIQRAKQTFYEAVRHCPSSKAVYLDRVTYFPDSLKEVHDLMAEKQLLIRLPIEELDVLLELEEESAQVKDFVMDEGELEKETFVQKRKARESRSEGELGESD